MTRRLAILLALAAFARGAVAGENGRPGRRPEVDVIVPFDPYQQGQMYWSDGRPHHQTPGTVTINRPGYVCDLDHQTFSDRNAFVAHLRRTHKVPEDRIPGALVTVAGQVHFAGE